MEEKKLQQKKNEKAENVFQDIPSLKRYFEDLEYTIRNFGRYRWQKTVTREKLKRKRQEVMTVVHNLDNIDLNIIYYLKNTYGVSRRRLLEMLRNTYGQQCDFKNQLYNTNEYTDPLNIGWLAYGNVEKEEE